MDEVADDEARLADLHPWYPLHELRENRGRRVQRSNSNAINVWPERPS